MKDLKKLIGTADGDRTIEPLNDYQARLDFLAGSLFGVAWQGLHDTRGIPYGSIGYCRAEFGDFLAMFETPRGIVCITVETDTPCIFIPAWGRSLADMLAPDESPTVNRPPLTVNGPLQDLADGRANVPPAPWETCCPGHRCETCQRIQEVRREAVKRDPSTFPPSC